MTGLEKIIEDIRAESKAAQDRTIGEAREKAAETMQKAEQDARAAADRIRKNCERSIEEGRKRTESAADLERRRKMLAAKQEMIASVMERAKEEFRNLPDEKRFAVMRTMAARAAHPGEKGVIRFSGADLQRVPSDFEEQLAGELPAGSTLKLAEDAADIPDGFVLDYAGVEENCSIDAVLAGKRDELLDKINQILF